MSILLVSAAFGSSDAVKPLPEHDRIIKSRLYTDARPSSRLSETWQGVVEPNFPRADFGARLRSQYFKHQIHRLEVAFNMQWLVWADASLRFFELDFIVEWAERLAREPAYRRMLFIPHPQRNTIGEEAVFIQEQLAISNVYVARRYTVEQTQAAMQYLVQHGCRPAAPLYCGGLWMVENTSPHWSLLNAWWDCNLRYGDGAIDQLALGGLLNRDGFQPHRLEVDLFNNQHFAFVAHQ